VDVDAELGFVILGAIVVGILIGLWIG